MTPDSPKQHGRWAFAEFTDVWAMQEDFAKVVEKGFGEMISDVIGRATL